MSSAWIRQTASSIVGRRDRMVKRRGYRIELGEIERGLYQHESIAEAAVVAVPDAVGRRADRRLLSSRTRSAAAVDHRDEDRSARSNCRRT